MPVWAFMPSGAGKARKFAGIVIADPRLPQMGHRVYARSAPRRCRMATTPRTASALACRKAGEDYAYGDTFPHEALMDQFGGVDFKKGCYVGQEVVSRMQHRGTARNRVVMVSACR